FATNLERPCEAPADGPRSDGLRRLCENAGVTTDTRREPEAEAGVASPSLVEIDDALPKDGRWPALAGLPLVHNSLPSRTDARRERRLRQAHSPSQVLQVLVVVIGNGWQGGRAHRLTAEAPIVPGKELRARGT